ADSRSAGSPRRRNCRCSSERITRRRNQYRVLRQPLRDLTSVGRQCGLGMTLTFEQRSVCEPDRFAQCPSPRLDERVKGRRRPILSGTSPAFELCSKSNPLQVGFFLTEYVAYLLMVEPCAFPEAGITTVCWENYSPC